MGIRSTAKKGIKRIGRAFGFSEVYDRIAETKSTVNAVEARVNEIGSQLYGFDGQYGPFVKFYYYNEVAKNIHPLLFEKYRNCNKGKKLVIVACGPSVDKYKPIANAKHLAINRAFLKDDIKFDYIFMHDNVMVKDYGDELASYDADKFVAYATSASNAKLFNVKSEDVTRIGAKRFLISDPSIMDIEGGQFDVIQPDITNGVLLDRGGGTVFSALQFALFTGASEIYLVGCDCTSKGYFGKVKGTRQNLLEKTEQLWYEVASFVEQYYPETKIISVNPVTLKGLFVDLEQ